jgi:hypothetical protein
VGQFQAFLKEYALKYDDDHPDVVNGYEGKIKFEAFRD